MSDDQNEFEKGDSVVPPNCLPCTAGNIKKGGYCMLKHFPCKVTDYSTAKPGKHGSAKVTIVGVDVFTNKKYQGIFPTSATVYVPNLTKQQVQVTSIAEDDYVSFVYKNGQINNSVKLPAEDEQIYGKMKKVWQGRGDQDVLFTLITFASKQKFVSARQK